MADNEDEVDGFRNHMKLVQSEAYDLLKSAGYEDQSLTDLKLSNWPSFPLPKVLWDGDREPKPLEHWALDYLGLYQLAKRWIRECRSEEERRKAYYLLKLGSDMRAAETALYASQADTGRNTETQASAVHEGGAKEIARSLYEQIEEQWGAVSFKALWQSLERVGVEGVSPDSVRQWLAEFRERR